MILGKGLFSRCLIPYYLLLIVGCSERGGTDPVKVRQSIKKASGEYAEPFQGQKTGSEDGQVQLNPEASEGKNQEEKIDGATLSLVKLRVTSHRDHRGNLGLNLAYIPDGRANYIEIQICPLEVTETNCPADEDCSRGRDCKTEVTAYNRVRLPLLYGGNVLYKARSCVDSLRALKGQSCGNWEEQVYSSGFYDPEVARLQFDIERIRKDLGRLVGEDYRNALRTFTEEAGRCDALNADVKAVLDSKVRVVQQYLRAPVAWFVQAGEDSIDSILGDGAAGKLLGAVGSLGKEISRDLEKICVKIGKGTHDGVCSFLKGAATVGSQFLAALNPISAIGTASNAIHDVYYGAFLGQGDKLIAKACYAEQNLQRTVQAIETQMRVRQERAGVIGQALEKKGESIIR